MASIFSPRALGAPARAALLDGLVDKTRERAAAKAHPAVVFDLDGTLLDNRPRVAAILHELAEAWTAAHPELARRVGAVTVEQIVYDIASNLTRLGVSEPAMLEEGATFWSQRFFTDSYIRHDTPVPGSVAYVRRLYDAGANIVYLTGRDLPNMALGTFASLRDLGYPIGVVGTQLVTKPDFETPDSLFKQSVAASLVRAGEVLAHFDNEPANCNLLAAAHPSAAAIFVDTHHAPNPPQLHPAVLVIDSFET
jgi:hydroxymethylpyrimidine pyrophosphatase-like HAD family hydrolase